MGLGRFLIVGTLAMAALYFVASAIAVLIPYAIGAFIIGCTVVGVHRWLIGKDLQAENDTLSQ